MQAAYDKANDTAAQMAWDNAVLPFKEALQGGLIGATTGCIWGLEGGCVASAVPGAIIGAFAGVLKGSATGIYRNIEGYIQDRNQLKQDVASCTQ